MKPFSSGIVNTITCHVPTADDHFALRLSGFLKIPEDGIYEFQLASSDGSKLYLNSYEVIDNDGWHPTVTKMAIIPLKAGLHPFIVSYLNIGGGFGTFRLKIKMPGSEEFVKIPADMLSHKPNRKLKKMEILTRERWKKLFNK